jgi:tetratricopeptide (TPR) repeat protein
MEAYRQQIEKNPENARYLYNYGSLLLNADRYDEAAEQLARAVELDPDDPKKQYNLGAAYLNKGVAMQDSLVSMRDSVMAKDREPTQEEAQMIKSLDEQRRQLFRDAIPPLERARQLSSPGDQYRQNACSALLQAYVQTEQTEKAEQVEECAGGSVSGSSSGNGGGAGSGSGGN